MNSKEYARLEKKCSRVLKKYSENYSGIQIGVFSWV
jgi:hypothetical protein